MKRLISVKKLTVWVTVLAVLLTCILPSDVVFADGQTANTPSSVQIVNAGGEETNNDGVEVSKVITGTDKENYFDITLNVETKQSRQELLRAETTDVVIVMDISNTMNNNDRLVNAKAAAQEFVTDFADSLGDSGRIGLVTFNRDAQVENGLTSMSVGNATSLNSKIGGIVAPSPDTSYDNHYIKWTNIEGGLQLAYNVIKQSDAKHKYVVLLTDGFPTTYIKSGRTSTEKIEGYTAHMALDATTANSNPPRKDNMKKGVDGYFYNYESNYWCTSGVDYSDKGATRAQTIASTIKNDGINVFSVGIDIGGQKLQTYLNSKTVDSDATPGYIIGDANDTSTYTTWLGNSIAGGNDLAGKTTYANGNDLSALKSAYAGILNSIIDINIKAIENTYIANDPMGDNVEFQYFYEKNANGEFVDTNKATELSGTHSLNGENNATYSDRINWTILKSGYTTSTLDNTTVYNYKLKYRVRLKNESSSFVENQNVATNGKTTLKYKVNDNGTLSGEKTIDFKIPEVKGYLGELSFNKIDAKTGQPMEGVEFKLVHKGQGCSVCGGDIDNSNGAFTLTATSDANGQVSFTNIPSGHEYELKETTPTGYVEGKTYDVVVAYDVVKVFDGQQDITPSAQLPMVIENTPEYIDVTGTKTWEDYNNYYKTRPESIELKLYRSVNQSEPVEVTGVTPVWDKTNNDAWTYKFEHLPKAENGNIINYSVRETEIDEYNVEYDQNNRFNINNRLEIQPSSGRLIVKKEVTGNDGAAPAVDAKYKFNLNVKVGLDRKDELKAEIDNLKDSIKDIEDEDVSDIRAQIADLKEQLKELQKIAKIVELESTKFELYKELLKTFRSTSREQIKNQINNIDEQIDSLIAGEFLGNNEIINSFKQVMEDISKIDFKNFKFDNIKNIIEKMKNLSVNTEKDITTITNQIKELNAKISQQANKLNIRDQIANLEKLNNDINATITVKLTPLSGTDLEAKEFELTTSSEYYSALTKSYNIPFELYGGTGYEIEIFANREVAISYSVTETDYPKTNYNKTSIIVNNSNPTEAKLLKNTEDFTLNNNSINTITFINDYYKENVTGIKGLKVWSDNSNKFNTRPTDVTLKLYKTVDGVKSEVKDAKPSWANKSSESDVWIWEYTNLPLYENGKVITYSVEEVNVDKNYLMRQEGNVIVNKLDNGKFKFDVEKTVTDKNNAKPDADTEYEFNVNIKATNATKDSIKEQLDILKVQLNELKNIDKDTVDDGIATIRDRLRKLAEDIVAGKVTAEELKAYKEDLEAKITELKKIDVAELQKEVAAVIAMIENLEIDTKTCNKQDLDKIVAKIKELHNMGLDDLKVNGTTIVNQAELLKYMFTGVDETITVKLIDEKNSDNNKEYVLNTKSTMYDSESDSYNIPFKLKDGQKYDVQVEADRNLNIKYVVKETKYETTNYNKTVVTVGNNSKEAIKTDELQLEENNSPSIVFNNYYYMMQTVDISGTKKWEDAQNKYGTRPNGVDLELTKIVDGVSTVLERDPQWTNNGENSDVWNWTYTNLPKYTDDTENKEINYSVKEINVNNEYTMTQNGNEITNTLKEETVIGRFTVSKEVDGADDVKPANTTEYKFSAKITLPEDKVEPVTIKLIPLKDSELEKKVCTLNKDSDEYDEKNNTYTVEFSLLEDTEYTVEVIADRDVISDNNVVKYAVEETEYATANYKNTLVSVNGKDGITGRNTSDRVLNKQNKDEVLFTNVYEKIVTPPESEEPVTPPSKEPEIPVETTNPPLNPSEEPEVPTTDPSEEPTVEPSKEPVVEPTKDLTNTSEEPTIIEDDTYFKGDTEKNPIVVDNNKDSKNNKANGYDTTPKTSDNNNLVRYYGLIIISSLGLSFMLVIAIRKRLLNR